MELKQHRKLMLESFHLHAILSYYHLHATYLSEELAHFNNCKTTRFTYKIRPITQGVFVFTLSIKVSREHGVVRCR